MNILGFDLDMAVPEAQDDVDKAIVKGKEYIYAMLSKDGVEVMFQRSDSFKRDLVFAEDLPIGASVSFYMEIEGFDDFYNRVKDKAETTTPKTTWYGMKEFYMKDPNGYILGFASRAK